MKECLPPGQNVGVPPVCGTHTKSLFQAFTLEGKPRFITTHFTHTEKQEDNMCPHVNTHTVELLDHMCVCPYWLADASKSNMDPQGTGNLLL